MILIRLLIIVATLLVFASVTEAQTTTELQWDHVGATPAQVATYNPSVKVDGVVVSGVPTCTAQGGNTTCKLNVGNVTNGSHTFAVSTLVDNVVRETILTKVFPLSGPPGSQPTGQRFTITITITSP
jgi:hypothetical protein